MILHFSQPMGPKYHYMKPSGDSFGGEPNLRDPLAKKYVYLKQSHDIPIAGKLQILVAIKSGEEIFKVSI